MKNFLKSLVMLFVASAVSFSMVSCSDDDDEDNVVFECDGGKIIDKGDVVVVELTPYLSTIIENDEEKDFTLNATYTARFSGDKCVSLIGKEVVTPESFAKAYYEILCYGWESDFDAKPELKGNVITFEQVKKAGFEGASKSKIIANFELFFAFDSDDEDEE